MRLSRDVEQLAQRQEGVLTSAQLRVAGVPTSTLQRRVQAGIWQRPHRGVVVLHSGPMTWRSRAWAGLLFAGDDAALSHRSAAFVHELEPEAPRRIELVIPEHRRVVPSAGLVIRRRRRMPRIENRSRFPVIDRPNTVLDLLSTTDSQDDAVGLICAAVRAGTWPEQIMLAGARRAHLRHRGLLTELLADVAAGVESPLERRYHRDVERRHALPAAQLQVREQVGGRWIRADRVYPGLGVRVELDGELAHPGGRTDQDVWRDNAVLIETSQITLRYRWRHVRVTPCETAAQVAAALTSRGWTGRPRPCTPHCQARP